MYDVDEHVDNLLRHKDLVCEACCLLGKRLIKQGRTEFGRQLISAGYLHDASKFFGIEWDYLHMGPDVPRDKLELAIQQHLESNTHHPEYHGGVQNMGELDVAEMVCDWYARSQEFATGLRDWIEEEAIKRYDIKTDIVQWAWIQKFLNMLLEHSFVGQE